MMATKVVLQDWIRSSQAVNSADECRSWSGVSAYTDALFRILLHKQWTVFPHHMIAGMTASAFRLVVDRRLTSKSISAYNWMAENFVAADFIGVTTGQHGGFSFEPTFPLYQKQALLDIKASIDRGIGAILWHDQFVIVIGYDDVERVLFICKSNGNEVIRLSYDSLGRNSTPYWYYQVLEACAPIDQWEVCKESLIQAVYKWETHDYMLPPQDYACGAAAYAAIAVVLQTETYDTEQAAAVLCYYAKSRLDIASYVAGLKHLSIQMDQVINEYELLANLYTMIVEVIDDSISWDSREPECVQRVIELIRKAGATEQRAIDAIKRAFPETIGNRFDDVGLR
ncbi:MULTISPECIES: hypothetical protein [unclassified Paenibacillus]|uniref:hypothetical protein n=2 Tax=unclassified Paenibacillus TaxID=185978 RepID=UPI000CFB0572|nr:MULTISPECIES: hypothetical protein [unclassified Paenibacillus]PQZ99873.1 hypothetical protein CQ043_27620 [Paenibacillus sp. MYb63]PRA44127.1 hypothetical protein CQ061_26240 [Paenibacillus sp. MYb67]QZN76376.1 hypothetical protein K5K90_03560 [Paenibacillus sp. DR312]